MDTLQLTPKIPKKSLLSKKRNCLKRSIISSQQYANVSNLNNDLCIEFHQSPSSFMWTTNLLNTQEETSPPHKILNLNDSLEFSPHNLMSSQTLLVDSPEVDYRWSTQSENNEDVDKLLKSVNNKAIVTPNLRIGKRNTIQRFANEMCREQQFKAVELEFHRKEKSREHDTLQRQCLQFQERLKTFHKLNLEQTAEEDHLLHVKQKTVDHENCVSEAAKKITAVADNEMMQNSSNTASFIDIKTLSVDTNFSMNDSIRDFFNENNSDIDDLLLAATQNLETSKVEFTQKTPTLPKTPTQSRTQQSSTIKSTVETFQIMNKAPQQKCKRDEKRSSFYWQFLEDEMPDDFFASFDDIVQQAVASKKLHKRFERHNSMPTETIVNFSTIKTVDAENTESSHLKIKRHTSSHAFSSSNDNSNGRYFHLKQ